MDIQIVQEISKILGELVTGSKITHIFKKNNWRDYYTATGDKMLSTKWKRLEDTLNFEMNKSGSIAPFITLIEDIMKPFEFRNNIDLWNESLKNINEVIAFCGLELLASGKVIEVKPVDTLQEAIQRTNSLYTKLIEYNVHPDVIKYCKQELLQENYFHAVLEASKIVLQRIRDLNLSGKDGNTLINDSFNLKNPSIIIKDNLMSNETEKSQYQGLKSLLNTVCYLYRNPTAHSPKMYDDRNERDAIQALLIISMAHTHLDNCICVRFLEDYSHPS